MIESSCRRCDASIVVQLADARVLEMQDCGVVVFTCPTCGEAIARRLTPALLQALVAAGVVEAVARTRHPERSLAPDAPTFTTDDVVVLHELLESPDWFAALCALADDHPGHRPSA